MTAYAPIQLVATQANQAFPIPWPFIRRADVTATLDGVPVNITWVSDALLELPNDVGDSVVIQRFTSVDNPAHVFKGGSLAAKPLNEQINQLLFRAQELPFLASNGIQIPGPPGPPGEPGPLGSGSGDVLGPATNTDNYVPQWSGNNSKRLGAGRHIGVDSTSDILDRAAGDGRYLGLLTGGAVQDRVSIEGAGKLLNLSHYGDATGAFIYSGPGRSTNISSNLSRAADGSSLSARQAKGSLLDFGGDDFNFRTFEGATVGQPPTFITRLRWTAAAGWITTSPISAATPTDPGHLTTKAYVDGVAGGAPVLATVVLNSDLGTANLAGLHNKVVKLVHDFLDDANIWNFSGMTLGQITTVIPTQAFGLLFENIDGVAQHLIGNWEGVDRAGGGSNTTALPVNQRDILEVICVSLAPYQVRVFVKENQFISRPLLQQAGSSQDPEGSYISLGGMVGKWSPTKGIAYGNLLVQINETNRGIITGKLFLRGVGDSSSIFFENYAAEDQDEGLGLEEPKFAIPWDDYARIGNRVAWVAKIADGAGKLIPCQDIIGPGAPGSINSAEYAVVQGYARSLPTTSSTPGGLALMSCPPGQNSPTERLIVSSLGATVVLGLAAQEAYGTFAECTLARLTEFNIPQWHIPSLDVAREYPHHGDLQLYPTPVDSSKNTRGYASISLRKYGKDGSNDHPEGVDLGYRADEDMYWFFPVTGNVRGRGLGFRSTEYGYFTKSEGAADVAQFQGGRYAFGAGNTSKTINLRSGQWGSLRIVLTSGHYADFGVSADSSLCRMGYTTDAAQFSTTAGDTSKWRATLVGGRLVVTNPSGGGASCFLQLQQ